VKLSLAIIGIAILVGVFLAARLPVPSSQEPSGSAVPPPPAQVEEPEPPVPANQSSSPSSPERPHLFRPEDLPLLEGPDRALWQKPDLVMDLLHIADGSRVADIGAGAGWFTMRLARRVGPNGIVYAQDLQREMTIAIARRVKRENLDNVQVIQGLEDSVNLPRDVVLDAVLVVDVYPELKGDRVQFLRSLAASLQPKGRIGIVNYKPGSGGPGPGPSERVASSVVEQDARRAKLRVIGPTTDLRYQYLVVIGL
jgi:ubiquinone/menaquinone biosynthesis C-methylase UbiE